MPKSSFVDFKAIKAAVTMEQVLDHYGFADRFKKTGDSLSGPCPIHGGSNPTQFRISISKNIWNCFSECKRGGNVLDFIARMEEVSIHAAALKAIEWFHLDPEAMKASSEDGEQRQGETPRGETARAPKPDPQEPTPKEANNAPNKPLKFRLEKLERNHPYLAERGLASAIGGIVGYSLCRELAPVMMSILIAGRIGSAMAAEIGSMFSIREVITARPLSITNSSTASGLATGRISSKARRES